MMGRSAEARQRGSTYSPGENGYAGLERTPTEKGKFAAGKLAWTCHKTVQPLRVKLALQTFAQKVAGARRCCCHSCAANKTGDYR